MSTSYSQSFWKFFVVIFLITQIVQNVVSKDELQFTCDALGHIATITKGTTDPQNILIKISDTTYCHYFNETCKTSHVKTESTLHVIIQEEKDNKLYAGKSNLHYQIECKNEFNIDATAFPFIVSPSSKESVVVVTLTPPVLSLKIKRRGSNLIDASKVFIGEPLQLEMSSTGNIVYPKSCTAMDGEQMSTTADIWTYHKPSGDTVCSTFDSAITEEKWTLQKSDNKTLTIPIFAFQFTTSSKVIIKCSAHVCTSRTSCSHISENTCVNHVVSRRKRRSLGIIEDAKTEHAYVSFSVKSKENVQSKANALPVHFTLVVAVVVFGKRMVAFLQDD